MKPLAGFSVLFVGLLALGTSLGADQQPRFKMRWVMAHEPVSQFEKAGRHFAKLVAEKTHGGIEVQILTSSEFTGGRKLSPAEVVEKLRSGELEMSQTYTATLGRYDKPLWILELPMLFRSHDHVAKVVDGAIGQELLAGLGTAGMHGLAFTYSGGYRVISSSGKEIRSVDDFKGLKIRTSQNGIAQESLRAFGAQPVTLAHEEAASAFERGLIQGSETTYPRFWELGEQEKGVPVINETSHNVLLTALVVNKKFFDALPSSYQEAVIQAAREAAKMERGVSVEQGKEVRAKAIQQGIKVVEFPKQELAKLESLARPLYEKYNSAFLPNLVSRIRETK